MWSYNLYALLSYVKHKRGNFGGKKNTLPTIKTTLAPLNFHWMDKNGLQNIFYAFRGQNYRPIFYLLHVFFYHIKWKENERGKAKHKTHFLRLTYNNTTCTEESDLFLQGHCWFSVGVWVRHWSSPASGATAAHFHTDSRLCS